MPSKNLNNKEYEFVNSVKSIIVSLNEMIELSKIGKNTDGNTNQLLKIEYELNKMCDILDADKYVPGFGRAIADLWDNHHN